MRSRGIAGAALTACGWGSCAADSAVSTLPEVMETEVGSGI